MKKFIALTLAALMVMTMLAACGAQNTASSTTTTTTTATTAASAEDTSSASGDGSTSISTDGSTSMQKVIGGLGEAFTNAHEGYTFTYNPTGSGSGITAVSEGRCDIGLSSRALKDEEVDAGLVGTVLAYDGIAVIVHPDNPVTDLSVEDLARIFTGEITNWSEVGGDDAEIVLIGREAGSGTRDGFESVTGTEDLCAYRQELTSNGDVITTVSGNAAAIGYASLSALKDSVHALSINGIEPSEATILDGTYPVQRPFLLVTNSETALSDAAQAFMDYALSAEAAPIITQMGAVPAN